MPGQNVLFVANKQDTANKPATLPTVFREIERWANSLTFGAGGITQITSADGSVTIANPTGPVTDLHVTTGGGGAAYASLVGPGYTTTPGSLIQTGGFTVLAKNTDPYDPGLTRPGFHIRASGFTGATIGEAAIDFNSDGGVDIQDASPNASASWSRLNLLSIQNPIQLNGTQLLLDARQNPTPNHIRLRTGSAGATPSVYPGILIQDDTSSTPTTSSQVTIRGTNSPVKVYGWGVTISTAFASTPIQPLWFETGPNAGASGTSGMYIWCNNGPPNVVSSSTGGGVVPINGTNFGNWCFDNYNGHIWFANNYGGSPGTWTMLV